MGEAKFAAERLLAAGAKPILRKHHAPGWA